MHIQKLLDAITSIVADSGTWQEKRNAILAEADETERTNLDEFLSWFDESGEED
jgi:hypothetical protein